MEVWLIEAARGLGRLFINPLLYWFIVITLLASLARIKRERKFFGTKISNAFAEWKHTWSVSVLSGLLLSIVFIGIGFVVNYSLLITSICMVILLSLSRNFKMLSPAFTLGFTFIVVLTIPMLHQVIPSEWVTAMEEINYASFAILLGLLLLIEAVVLLRLKRHDSFPELMKGNRGRWVGQHRVRKIAMIPFLMLIPVGDILPIADWWPYFSINGESFGLIVVPFITGFEFIAKGSIPVKLASRLAQSVLILGLFIIGLGIAGFYVEIIAIVAFGIAIIMRSWISIRLRTSEQQKQPIFTPDPNGLLILGIIKGSPADQLGLLVGERIEKVNGKKVTTEQEFYEALQFNSAFCKLDVRDDRGEIRFAQRAIYEGEHHELGIIFVKDDYLVRK